MVSLRSVHCPRCGAELKLDAKRESATCSFCGTTSYTKASHAADAPVVVVKSHVTVLLALLLALGGLGVAAVALLSARQAAPAALPLVAPGPTGDNTAKVPARAVEPTTVPTLRARLQLDARAPARLADVDGDGKHELVVAARITRGATTSEHYAVFDVESGTLRAHTVAIEQNADALSALSHGRLVLADRKGQLAAYDLVSGALQWKSALGERVAALCRHEPASADALHVTSDDGRELLLDVKSGRQSSTRERCTIPLAVAEGRSDPRDRRDRSAPPGVEAYRCGSTRVMGSANYVVPDACKQRAGVDTDRIEGLVGHRLWRYGAGFLVFGVRKPGTYVPMVGLIERGRLRWKSEVPASDPLAAREGGPRFVALSKELVMLTYEMDETRRTYVTCFAADDGRRVWTSPLPEGANVIALLANDDMLVVQLERRALLLSRVDGALRAELSEVELAPH